MSCGPFRENDSAFACGALKSLFVVYYLLFITCTPSYGVAKQVGLHNSKLPIKQTQLWPLLLTWINFNPSMDICKYIHYKLYDEITYPFLNFNGATVEVLEWISNNANRGWPIKPVNYIILQLTRLCPNSSWSPTSQNADGAPPYWGFQRYVSGTLTIISMCHRILSLTMANWG